MARCRMPMPKRRAWSRAQSGEEECIVCGRALVDGRAGRYVHMLTTLELASHDEVVGEAEDQGFFAVGPECARKLGPAFIFSREHVFGGPDE